MKPLTTTFGSHRFSVEAAGTTLVCRILKMDNSVFVYIGKRDDEAFNGLGLGFTSNQQNKESVSTSISSVESTDSRDLAEKLSLRLKKPVFVSCNENLDRISKPLVEQRLIEEIVTHPEYF